MLSNIESVRNKLIYYINRIASWICVLGGAGFGLSASDGEALHSGLYSACAYLFAIAGIVSLRSCKKYKLILWAVALFIAALGLSTLAMVQAKGTINTTVWALEWIPALVNGVRLFWFVSGKEDRLAAPPKRERTSDGSFWSWSSSAWSSASSGKRAWGKAGFGDGDGGSGDYMVDDVMERYGISEKQARARIRSCQRDLDAAMDDGWMEELEDIVAEQLGDSSYTDDLI